MLPTTPTGTRQSEAGFTLIELSIVLIIIGLLIGGVLQGQEMINNTRIKTTVSQTDSIQAGVQTFEDKFGNLPGDFGSAAIIGATAATSVGFNDGIITASKTVANSPAAIGADLTAETEATVVFDHMEKANLLQGVNQAGATDVFFLPTRINGGAFDVATFTYNVIGTTTTKSIPDGVGIRIRGGTATSSAALLPPKDAFSLDTKYDDGNAITGRWQTEAVTTCIKTVTSGTTWESGDAAGCTMVISIK